MTSLPAAFEFPPYVTVSFTGNQFIFLIVATFAFCQAEENFGYSAFDIQPERYNGQPFLGQLCPPFVRLSAV